MKDAILQAHDAFAEGDLVYLSTKNLKIPKGRARKLIPKYIGPFAILKDFGNPHSMHRYCVFTTRTMTDGFLAARYPRSPASASVQKNGRWIE
ncbi:hypothetical protein NEOLEDRAFT_1132713 [Neolentinus lepideus HHB14362 ss-1]|uniref:Tf2-1-like SH3-like domain-containing protein n=1 Tax=Neolentinus lepideus HHB14362 ss-1 TaxID=1314782 RepID=A0A165T524_9AGAM|nr:hypothetical protein NEOLEDRAFT_1132713 [Neolentinus lepideus HHB14362 ss-1]